ILDVLNNRVGLTLVQFAVPMLGAYGLAGLLPALVSRAPSWRTAFHVPRAAVAAAAIVFSFAFTVADLDVYASAAGPADVWMHHVDNPCHGGPQDSALCGTALASQFNVLELANACLTPDQQLRLQVEVCADLGSASNPHWDSSNNAAIARLVDRCRVTGGSYDRVCGARIGSFLEQVTDPAQWRSFQVGCYSPACPAARNSPSSQTVWPSPPQRAVVDAHTASLLESFHDATGGGQFYTYLEQGIPSPELDDFMKGAMLDQAGVPALKTELAAISGADAVVLSPSQDAASADYQAMGWDAVTQQGYQFFESPNPSGLGAQWAGGPTVLVVGQLSATPSHPYNDVFEQAARGMIPFSSGWLVRARSPYIDDYTDAELAGYPALVLLAYQYHDSAAAWQRLDTYVRQGGRLFVETGWQYADPDWNRGSGYSVLPVGPLGWGPLNPAVTAVVEGVPDASFGAFTYQGGGWGASSAPGVKGGAEPLVQVGGRVVAARWTLGRGRVVWSGMNLIAHSEVSSSADEDAFLARQFAWLLAPASGSPVGPASAIVPQWPGNDEARLSLNPSPSATAVLFKESSAPGWSAELTWPGGSRSVAIEPAEMDFMLVRLASVPAGAELVFHYGPTHRIYGYWAASTLVMLILVAWLVRPRAFAVASARLAAAVRRFYTRLGEQFRWESEDV
ncbi:MAG TPA: hypothetical protein VEW68_01735, partial [Patescibacteria group bacterium]|nr:hypothetical protein [Patescibacteria group bacterium]